MNIGGNRGGARSIDVFCNLTPGVPHLKCQPKFFVRQVGQTSKKMVTICERIDHRYSEASSMPYDTHRHRTMAVSEANLLKLCTAADEQTPFALTRHLSRIVKRKDVLPTFEETQTLKTSIQSNTAFPQSQTPTLSSVICRQYPPSPSHHTIPHRAIPHRAIPHHTMPHHKIQPLQQPMSYQQPPTYPVSYSQQMFTQRDRAAIMPLRFSSRPLLSQILTSRPRSKIQTQIPKYSNAK